MGDGGMPYTYLFQSDSVLRHKGIDKSKFWFSPAHFKLKQPRDIITTFSRITLTLTLEYTIKISGDFIFFHYNAVHLCGKHMP